MISRLDLSLNHCLEEVSVCTAQCAELGMDEHYCPLPSEEPIDVDLDDLLVAYV